MKRGGPKIAAGAQKLSEAAIGLAELSELNKEVRELRRELRRDSSFHPAFLPEEFVEEMEETETSLKSGFERFLLQAAGSAWYVGALFFGTLLLISLSHLLFLSRMAGRLDDPTGADLPSWTSILGPMIAMAVLGCVVGLIGFAFVLLLMPRARQWAAQLKASSPSRQLLMQVDETLQRERSKLFRGMAHAVSAQLPDFSSLLDASLAKWLGVKSPTAAAADGDETGSTTTTTTHDVSHMLSSLERVAVQMERAAKWMDRLSEQDDVALVSAAEQLVKRLDGAADNGGPAATAAAAAPATPVLTASAASPEASTASSVTSAAASDLSTLDALAAANNARKLVQFARSSAAEKKRWLKSQTRRAALRESVAVLSRHFSSPPPTAATDEPSRQQLAHAFLAMGTAQDSPELQAQRRQLLAQLAREAAAASAHMFGSVLEDGARTAGTISKLARTATQFVSEKMHQFEQKAANWQEEPAGKAKRRKKKRKVKAAAQ